MAFNNFQLKLIITVVEMLVVKMKLKPDVQYHANLDPTLSTYSHDCILSFQFYIVAV